MKFFFKIISWFWEKLCWLNLAIFSPCSSFDLTVVHTLENDSLVDHTLFNNRTYFAVQLSLFGVWKGWQYLYFQFSKYFTGFVSIYFLYCSYIFVPGIPIFLYIWRLKLLDALTNKVGIMTTLSFQCNNGTSLFIPTASTKLKGGYTGFTLSICLSVDRIVSALYLQQYSFDTFHTCTSYQATSEGVSHVKFVSKLWNFGKFFKFVTLILSTFDVGSNMTQ